MQDIGGAFGQLISEDEALGFVISCLLLGCCPVSDGLANEIVHEFIDLFNVLVERLVKAPRSGPDLAAGVNSFRLGSRESSSEADIPLRNTSSAKGADGFSEKKIGG